MTIQFYTEPKPRTAQCPVCGVTFQVGGRDLDRIPGHGTGWQLCPGSYTVAPPDDA